MHKKYITGAHRAPYSREPQAVGAVYDRPDFFLQSPFEAGIPVALFQTRIAGGGPATFKPQYSSSRDGRFLINQPVETATQKRQRERNAFLRIGRAIIRHGFGYFL